MVGCIRLGGIQVYGTYMEVLKELNIEWQYVTVRRSCMVQGLCSGNCEPNIVSQDLYS